MPKQPKQETMPTNSSTPGILKTRLPTTSTTSMKKAGRPDSATPRTTFKDTHWTEPLSRPKLNSKSSRRRDPSPTPEAAYSSFGRSSDLSYGKCPEQIVPDPYAQFERDPTCTLPDGPFTPIWLMKANERLRAKLKQVSERSTDFRPWAMRSNMASRSMFRSSRPDRTPIPCQSAPPRHGEGEHTPNGQDAPAEAAAVEDDEAKEDEEEEEEIDEEPRGPQAVQAVDAQLDSLSAPLMVVRERRTALMESIVKEVPPSQLIEQLERRGFFNSSTYQEHVHGPWVTTSKFVKKLKRMLRCSE